MCHPCRPSCCSSISTKTPLCSAFSSWHHIEPVCRQTASPQFNLLPTYETRRFYSSSQKPYLFESTLKLSLAQTIMDCNGNDLQPLLIYDYAFPDYEDGSFQPSTGYLFSETEVLPITDYLPRYEGLMADPLAYRQLNSGRDSAGILYSSGNACPTNNSQSSSSRLSCETSKVRQAQPLVYVYLLVLICCNRIEIR